MLKLRKKDWGLLDTTVKCSFLKVATKASLYILSNNNAFAVSKICAAGNGFPFFSIGGLHNNSPTAQ
ncbi:MAG: hypothetical protein JW737_08735 [Acidobacteria bacterium]|nr:hypothetical protein [Acidobacteriota bacterium]